MRRFPIPFLLVLAVPFLPVSSSAIGFGKVASVASLGQPLDFTATVRLDGDESLERHCVFAEVDAGENRLGADQVRISVQRGAEPGERRVRVTTLRKIDEPVVGVNVTLGCASPVTRRFVAFLDPPSLRLARAGDADAGAPAADAQERPERPSSRAPVPRGDARVPARYARADDHKARKVASRRMPRRLAAVTPMARRPAASASRLQLETAMPPLAPSPAAAATAALPADESATLLAAERSAAQALRTELAEEHARVRVLEAGIASLIAESRATRLTMAGLQARLQEPTEAPRDSWLLMGLLGGLCTLLTVFVGWVAWRAARHHPSRWWDPTQLRSAAEPPSPSVVAAMPTPAQVPPLAPATSSAHGVLVETDDDAPWVYQAARLPVAAPVQPDPTLPSAFGGLEITTLLDPGLLARVDHPDPAANASGAADVELTMESLIDLDQQVEFFVVLGRDDAAAELLEGRLRQGGATCPLLFFRLLEILRRTGDEIAHARVAAAFHERFGAIAPDREAPLAPALGLQPYGAVTEALQAVWAEPTEAMRTLDAWVFQRRPADPMLDASAYREMLFLYSLARELAEGPIADGVDLLLPIDGDATDAPLLVETSPSHFAELYALPSRPAVLDLDVSIAAPATGRSKRRKAV